MVQGETVKCPGVAQSKPGPQSNLEYVVLFEDCWTQAEPVQLEGAGAVLPWEWAKIPFARCAKLVETCSCNCCKRWLCKVMTLGGLNSYAHSGFLFSFLLWVHSSCVMWCFTFPAYMFYPAPSLSPVFHLLIRPVFFNFFITLCRFSYFQPGVPSAFPVSVFLCLLDSRIVINACLSFFNLPAVNLNGETLRKSANC